MSGAPARLTSLDAFRGFTIAAMVLVNNPGDWSSLYSQLAHAQWNGWTFTDWIFPFFLFIGGVSMAFSLGRLAEAGADKPALLAKLAKRAALIFLIGFALNLIPAFDVGSVRIPGVLQRIALCTVLAAPIVVYCSWRGQLAWIAALLAIYSVLMLRVPVPGIGAGVLEPGKDFGAWLDRMLMDGHLGSGGAAEYHAGAVQPAAGRARGALAAVEPGASRQNGVDDAGGLAPAVAGRNPRRGAHADQQKPVDALVLRVYHRLGAAAVLGVLLVARRQRTAARAGPCGAL
jgi:predicted acyltransferase